VDRQVLRDLYDGLTPSTAGSARSARSAAGCGTHGQGTAQTQLNALSVAAEGSTAGYSRDLLPHWSTVSGSCNTRETVLKRDGSSVVVDIDHLVPLAEALRSGANTWTSSKRQQFANDLAHPQLIAVTDNVNQAKGDQDPSSWQPPLTSYRCTYAKMWIAVKYYWSLKLQQAEKTAVQSALNTCTS
jgi:hypothetical protein